MNIFDFPRVAQYVGVQRDTTIKKGGTQYRILLYGAKDVFGLIGSEHNGIAILNEDAKDVVADRIGCINTGYFGAPVSQVDLWKQIVAMPARAFKEFVNGCSESRYQI